MVSLSSTRGDREATADGTMARHDIGIQPEGKSV